MKQAPGKRRKQKLIAEISIPDPLPSYIGKVLRNNVTKSNVTFAYNPAVDSLWQYFLNYRK